MSYPRLVEQLIEHLTRLPGVGRRSAERMALWILNSPNESANELAKSIVQLKEELSLCSICNNLSEGENCDVCKNPARDRTTICIVEDHKHLLAIERTGAFKGLYHVLMGPISPADGRGPEDLKINQLAQRIQSESIKEVVIATDPDTEGEMTAIHIAEELKPIVRVSRIGLGIPVGSSVEYADMSTLSMSMSARREIE